MPSKLDEYDLKILNELQLRGRQSNAELAEKIHLSASQCLRRVRRLEEEGVIRSYAALLNPEALGLGIQAFIHITLEKHDEDPAKAFSNEIRDWEEVLGCWAITGDTDYLMHVVAPCLKIFSALVLKRLLAQPMVASVKSSILLEELKMTNVLPSNHLQDNQVEPF
tara:strand:+ start:1381 stop:1878 length:498 start_codon:yes stop_codon:yes gene_type:complete